MNPFIQKVLVVTALVIAVTFLVSKFLMPKKAEKNSACGKNDCGCH